jgi:hypothetical protein
VCLDLPLEGTPLIIYKHPDGSKHNMLFLSSTSHTASEFPFLKNLEMGFGMAMLCGRIVRVNKLVKKHDEDSVIMDERDELLCGSGTSEETTTDGGSSESE